jgi:NADP-dependent 3-hydroxy acid dehydrogenase YdfG
MTTPTTTTPTPGTETFPADHRRPRLRGRVAFVTGGTRGIGAAISHSFAEQGAIVAAGYGRDTEHANQLLTQLRNHGVDASIHQGNVGSSEDCRRTINEVIDTHGRLDILVNNAGITIDKTVLKMTDEDWYKVIAVNLSGTFFTSQAVLSHMVDRGSGRIVNISSVIGEIGNIGQANYAASKSGCSASPRRSRARRATSSPRPANSPKTRSGSPLTPSPPASSPPRCSSTSPRRCSTRSRRKSRSDGSAAPTKSRASCTSSSPTTPRSSPAR